MSAPRAIACPADSSAPLHFAAYDSATETLSCPTCGKLTAAELSDRLAAEMVRFESEFPALATPVSIAEDEREAQEVAGRVLRAFPSEPAFAVELFLAWGLRALGGRLPEEHLALCAERALDRMAA